MKLYGKLHYQQEMCILSAGYGRMIFHRVMALCTYSGRAISQQNDGNSMKLYGKLHYQEEMCILSAGSGRMIFHRVMAL